MKTDFSHQFAYRTVAGEARSCSPAEQVLVSHAILNRLKAGHWGKTLAAVVDAWRQFSEWNPGDKSREYLLELPDDDPVLARCAASFDEAEADQANGVDPTGGATFFYSPAAMVPPGSVPGWAPQKVKTLTTDHFVFYRDLAPGEMQPGTAEPVSA